MDLRPRGSQQCHSCGVAPIVDGPIGGAVSKYYHFQVHAKQGEMALGRSLLANVIGGEPALIRCTFEVLNDEGLGCVDHEEFMIYAGQGRPIENLSGTNRSEAENALVRIDQRMQVHGCERIASGPHWYSYRYRVRDEVAARW